MVVRFPHTPFTKVGRGSDLNYLTFSVVIRVKGISDYKIFRILSAVWMAVIFLLSSRQDLPGMSLFPGQDKAIHVLVFGILGFLFVRSFRPRQKELPFSFVLLATLMVSAYGGFDEIHQIFVPGREATVGDLTADTIGGFLASIFFWKR